jgi:NADPH-dependent 2,4-dienoyl-CoA reductase/sulfur reductase-like enzyme
MGKGIARAVRFFVSRVWKYRPMHNATQYQFDVLVVGAGPAGLSAASCAAGCGVRVGIVDDNPALGGQIWRGPSDHVPSEAGRRAQRLRAAGVQVLSGTQVFHHRSPGTLFAEGPDGAVELGYGKLVLATGAKERFLPFPGWTLPNVMGAGGLQALVKSGLPIAGKRVVVAGSGPLLLAVAAYLRGQGATIPLICEQASWVSLARFGVALLGQPKKIRQAWALRKQLAGVPFAASSWPLFAHGENSLERVAISRNGKSETIACDYLACGFHLVPNAELAALLGCRIAEGWVQVDEWQQTSIPGVYCAGEPTGIGGLELALVEGQIAGWAAGGNPGRAQGRFRERGQLQKFVRVLERSFALRPELRTLRLPGTIICRCEDVPYARVAQHGSWRAAKLLTRCGMGPCQGRVCGPVIQFLFNWLPDSVRPPIFPTSLESLAAIRLQPEPAPGEFTGGPR